MAYQTPFLYDAARWRAEDHGLAVLGSCYVSVPDGCGRTDAYGNPLKAERAWLGLKSVGAAGVGAADSAYAVLVSSIHQQATPDAGTVLAEIRRCLLTLAEFPTREEYIAAMLPYVRGEDPLRIGNQWAAAADCALRARHALPAELVEWLLSLNCGRY